MRQAVLDVLRHYNLEDASVQAANEDNDVFKITDRIGKCYFLKLYTQAGSEDFIPGENVYHTYEQIKCEMEILAALADEPLGTAVPLKNKADEWITVLEARNQPPVFATATTYIDAPCMEQSIEPMPEMAYCAGKMTAQLHAISENKLSALAVLRPHKRQDYVRRMLGRISTGLTNGNLTATQMDMFNECGAIILDCMNKLDAGAAHNVGLVHTDIRAANCLYIPGKCIPIDFSRSVYSYYLYDIGEMYAHMGGPETRREILRGYHEARPFQKGQLYMVQVFFLMFLMTVMAEFIEREESAPWRQSVLKTFQEKYYPETKTGGFFEGSVLNDIREADNMESLCHI